MFEVNSGTDNEFPLHFRIPSWCRGATIEVNGAVISKPSAGIMEVVKRKWKNGDRVRVKLPMEVSASRWAKNSRSVERGPLVFALKLNERWEKGNEPKEGDYFSVFPTEEWNYGLVQEYVADPSKMKVTVKKFPTEFVWNLANAPVEITVMAKKIPSWKAIDGVAHQPVTDRDGLYKGAVESEMKQITLIPYGCTKVRIVAFPVVK
jgi:uncharacterized protein